MAKGKSKALKIIAAIAILLLTGGGFVAYLFYNAVYAPNVILNNTSSAYLYIPTGSSYEDVKTILTGNNFIRSIKTFDWVAKRKNYFLKIKPGRYRITHNMNNDELVNLLRSGKQEPVQFTFFNIRTKQQLASVAGAKLEVDSNHLLNLLNDETFCNELGFNTDNVMCLFIPNTYELYWTTNDSAFIKRMQREYKNFWNENRIKQAKSIGMTETEVSILASIVEEETNMKDDKPLIAGVYMNRLKKKMPLEADPTLKFALGDFSIKRLLNIDKEITSPYNTYKNAGLPPGPICLPSITSIDAVLYYSTHEYLFFCAREDLSGYSNFATTYDQHLVNARKYQAELNRRNIKR